MGSIQGAKVKGRISGDDTGNKFAFIAVASQSSHTNPCRKRRSKSLRCGTDKFRRGNKGGPSPLSPTI